MLVIAARLLIRAPALHPAHTLIVRGRATSTITCAAFFAIGTIMGVTIFAPLYCQMVLGASASLSGLALIAFLAGATIGALRRGARSCA